MDSTNPLKQITIEHFSIELASFDLMHINRRHRMLIILMIRQSLYFDQRKHYLTNLAIPFAQLQMHATRFFATFYRL